MMITEENNRTAHLLSVADKLMTAARTAPKAHGIDNLLIAKLDGDDLAALAAKMRELAARHGIPFFSRDADNVAASSCVVLVGASTGPRGLKKCGMCGFASCAEKPQAAPCVFGVVNLGIALGSAAAAAADERVDTRVMYTIGQAAMELGLLGPDAKIVFGFPLSATGKNPFFDRK
ncbi:MAG: DUF2148 domain-containing protein [Elusimicrobiaceae bacterium]|nr:DUF2148 domain-containing protein [Elusimicrobiaceae bacterium]